MFYSIFTKLEAVLKDIFIKFFSSLLAFFINQLWSFVVILPSPRLSKNEVALLEAVKAV